MFSEKRPKKSCSFSLLVCRLTRHHADWHSMTEPSLLSGHPSLLTLPLQLQNSQTLPALVKDLPGRVEACLALYIPTLRRSLFPRNCSDSSEEKHSLVPPFSAFSCGCCWFSQWGDVDLKKHPFFPVSTTSNPSMEGRWVHCGGVTLHFYCLLLRYICGWSWTRLPRTKLLQWC